MITNKKINFISLSMNEIDFPINFTSKALSSGKLGRKLNYPVMNLASIVDIDYGIYYGIINIIGKTDKYKILLINEENEPIEIYILQTTRAYFYDKILSITLLGFIRKTQIFTTKAKFTEAIENDIKLALTYFSK